MVLEPFASYATRRSRRATSSSWLRIEPNGPIRLNRGVALGAIRPCLTMRERTPGSYRVVSLTELESRHGSLRGLLRDVQRHCHEGAEGVVLDH